LTSFSVNFAAPAELRKWPSLGNQRRPDREAYLITAGPLWSRPKSGPGRKFQRGPEAAISSVALHADVAAKIALISAMEPLWCGWSTIAVPNGKRNSLTGTKKMARLFDSRLHIAI
jgi:hypothetical protein